MDQPGKVPNPARGQLNRERFISMSPFAPENLVSPDRFGRPVSSASIVTSLKKNLNVSKPYKL